MRDHVVLSVSVSVCCLLSAVFGLAACGKKGPPRAPLSLAPEAPQAIAARRLGDTVYLRMTVPAKSALQLGPYSVDRLEVYAVTLAPGAIPPPNRDILKPIHLVGRVEVRPPPDPDAVVPDNAPVDTRPRPGDVVTFVEKLAVPQLTPIVIIPPKLPKLPKSATSAKSAKGTSATAVPPVVAAPAVPGAGPAAAVGASPTVLTRIYVVRGVASTGHPGTASLRVNVPLLSPPGRARVPAEPTFGESSVTLTWDPPASSTDEAPGVQYNIYAVPAAGSGAAGAVAAPAPLNDKPLDVTTFAHAGAEPGKKQCFVIRSVATVDGGIIESDPSDPACVTPRDIFPPAAPKALSVVPRAGEIDLIWDPNTEPDLGGYLVLRGEAPGATLEPLTPTPLREPRYRDTTVKAGVTYVYAVVAVDRATPPNRSALSNRTQETAQ